MLLINPHIIRCHRRLSIREIPKSTGTDLIRCLVIPLIGCETGYNVQNYEGIAISGMTFHNLLCPRKGLFRIGFHRFHMMKDSYRTKCSHQNRCRNDRSDSFILFLLCDLLFLHLICSLCTCLFLSSYGEGTLTLLFIPLCIVWFPGINT